jgi:hypothetical protein
MMTRFSQYQIGSPFQRGRLARGIAEDFNFASVARGAQAKADLKV